MVAEKTGWDLATISALNLEALRLLVASWNRLASGEGKPKPSSKAEIKAIQKKLAGIR